MCSLLVVNLWLGVLHSEINIERTLHLVKRQVLVFFKSSVLVISVVIIEGRPGFTGLWLRNRREASKGAVTATGHSCMH